jgi:hypothetical protein
MAVRGHERDIRISHLARASYFVIAGLDPAIQWLRSAAASGKR